MLTVTIFPEDCLSVKAFYCRKCKSEFPPVTRLGETVARSPFDEIVSQSVCLFQSIQGASKPHCFLGQTVWPLAEFVQSCPTEIVFRLDEV
jgi:hypothetical protein